MSTLVAEFSAWNDIDLARAFVAAIKNVSAQGDVEVVDLRHVDAGPQVRVELAVRAADHAVVSEQSCLAWLGELVARQAADIRLSIGIALTGGASDDDVAAVFGSLGVPPAGAWREVRPARGVEELYDLIERWLHHVIASRPVSSQAANLAQDSSMTISENLPSSPADLSQTRVIRQKP